MSVNGAVTDRAATRDEAWKYTPVDEIIARVTAAVAATPTDVRGSGMSVPRALVDALAGSHGGPRLVFVNGFYRSDLSDRHDIPGVWCGIPEPHDPIEALANRPLQRAAIAGIPVQDRTGAGDILLLIVDEGVRLDQPLHVVHLAAPDQATPSGGVVSHPRTVIEVGSDSQLTVVETYCGFDARTVTNAATTIRLAARAELDHHRHQLESLDGTHVGHTRVEQGAGSRLRLTSVTVGGDIARNAIDVHLAAPGAHVELTGINVTAGRQRHDTVVTVDHRASRCVSNQRFAGVVGDHGRGSFSGEIIVRPGTVATDAHQTNRNLLLDAQAEADSRPWLRIFADDVRCTHGATVGRLDDDALFYLRSRGISHADARAMLIDAFIRDITDGIARESIRAHVEAVVAAAAPVGPKEHR